ncbi:MAG TPA: hypothetical protein VN822_06160 [Candidatus Acidoferrales bacterium]|nr:hypothetical protein [Candidatus Acidoferrales bacterium]
MNMEARERLIARFGWAAGLLKDAAAVREERLRRYQRALERIAQGAGNPVKIAAAAMRKEFDPVRRG